MQIFVLNVMGKSITLDVDSDAFVEDVKDKIQDKINIDPDLQRLTFCGKSLEYNNKTLKYYNIGSGSILHFSLKNPWKCANGSSLERKSDHKNGGVDWSDLAASAKAKVDAEIERRKDQYNSIFEVKIGIRQKAKALKKEIKNDKLGVEAVQQKMKKKNEEISSISEDIAKLREAIKAKHLEIFEAEREKQTLVLTIEEDQIRISEKQSRLDAFNCDMENLDENMKQTFVSDEEFLSKENDDLKKANAEKDDFLKNFLTESISAKKSLLECPVCFETAAPPIHKCLKEHLICSKCLPRLNQKCPSCKTDILKNTDSIFRLAEENWGELQRLISKMENL